MSGRMLGGSRSRYSTTEHMLVDAIKEQQQEAAASAARRRSTKAAKCGAGRSSATTVQKTGAKIQPGEAPQVKQRRRRATRAQKKAVKDLDNFDPSGTSKGKQSVKLPAIGAPGRSQSVLDEAPEVRIGIAAPSPDRFRSQSVEPTLATMDPRHTTMVWSPPHPTELLDKRTDLRTMFANGAFAFAVLLRARRCGLTHAGSAPASIQTLERSIFTSDDLRPT